MSKGSPVGGRTIEQGHRTPPAAGQMDGLHVMQAVHMRKSESALQLACSLHFKRQLGRYVK